MLCSHIGPNGQPSILAQQILEKVKDPGKRDKVMSYIYSEDFFELFGNWMKDPNLIPLDEIAMEPTFEWLDKKVNLQPTVDKRESLNEGQKEAVEKLETFLNREPGYTREVDGKKIPLTLKEFVALAEKQTRPVRTALMRRYIIQNSFLLTGPAGTGKTYTSEIAAESVNRLTYAAPTHQAASVLLANTKASKVITIASLLGTRKLDRPTNDQNKDDFYLIPISDIQRAIEEGTEPPAIFLVDNLLVDEASMVGGNMKAPVNQQLFINGKKTTITVSNDNFIAMAERLADRIELGLGIPKKFIFLGDYAQTPPVGTEGDNDALLLEELMKNDAQFSNLTQVMRTNDLQILEMLTAYRAEIDRLNAIRKAENKLSSDPTVAAKILPVPFANRQNSENIHFYNNYEDFVNQFIYLYQNRDNASKFDPNFINIINYNNDKHPTTVALVKRIRTALFGDPDVKYYPNETLITTDTTVFRSEQNKDLIVLEKDARVFVEKVEEGIKTGILKSFNRQISYKIKLPQLVIRSGKNSGTVFAASDMYQYHINNIYHGKRYANKVMSLLPEEVEFFGFPKGTTSIPYGIWLQLKALVPNFEYGYVVNNFKVQGTTVQYAMIDEANILKAPVSPKKKLQYVYTGLSRGKFKVFVFNGMNPVNTPEKIDAIQQEKKISIDVTNSLPEKVDVRIADIPENQVRYNLKSIEILQSNEAATIFEKGKKNNWDLTKVLTELQIPKEQKQLILDLGITDREQILLELATNYSYTVEINTAKGGTINDFEDPFSGEMLPTSINEGNTSYYSNSTVPGGTNYTENEIATPGQLVEERPQGISTKQGVPELFESNPELSSIGTQQQYSQYLDTIFPDSKVKDIVYHISNKLLVPNKGQLHFYIDPFTRNSKNYKFHILKNIENIIINKDKNTKNSNLNPTENYIFDNFNYELFTAEWYNNPLGFYNEIINKAKEDARTDVIEYLKGKETNVILNIQNPYNENIKSLNKTTINEIKNKNKNNIDGIIGQESWGFGLDKTEKEIVVFEPEQIHILGSKQDIEGFKKFIKDNTKSVRKNAITPSIKGHAQFSTAQGIGWFRSDEQYKTSKDYPLSFKGNYGDTWEKRNNIWYTIDSDGITHKRDDLTDTDVYAIYDNQYGNKNYLQKGENTKTRRILEVQSDLFQKGRNSIDLIASKNGGNRLEAFYDEEGKNYDSYEDYKNDVIKDSQNQFLQLLNKDNNWVTFFIKSIIQDSAKKGYEKVLFPSGNTASKVEGHTTLEEFKKQKEDRIKELEEIEQGGLDAYNSPEKYYREPIQGYYEPKTLSTHGSLEEFRDIVKSNVEKYQIEIDQLKQELERVEKEGFGALKPIFKFYEETVTNILKKQGFSPAVITDEYGNTWNEVSLNKIDPNAFINASKTPAITTKKNMFTVSPTKVADKKAIIKASVATQFIGFGEGIAGSSTELYRQQILGQSKSNIEISKQKYTRQSVERDNNTLYLFTDNAERTSAPNSTTENVDKNSWYYKKYKARTNKPLHYGSLNNPTSAVIRGLNNAYPISTMSAYGTNWTDANFDVFKTTIDDEINQIKQDLPNFSNLKIGNYRIGQGGLKAKLPAQHQQYLDNKLKEIGIDNTQTEPKVLNQNTIVNSGKYNSNDVIFVSIGGKRGNVTIRKEQQDKTIKEALKAIEAGATLITDNKSYVESSDYNEGEKRLAKNLEAKGYTYSEQSIDGQLLGIWNKGTVSTESAKDATPATEIKDIVLEEPEQKVRRLDRVAIEVLKDQIRKQIITTAKENPNKTFRVNYNKMSPKLMASGYSTKEYAYIMDELVEAGEFPSNVTFTENFKASMNNSPNKLRKLFQSLMEEQEGRIPRNVNNDIINVQLSQMKVAVLDDQGNAIRLFDEIEQTEALESVIGMVYNHILNMQEGTAVSVILRRVLHDLQQSEITARRAGANAIADKYQDIVRSYAFKDGRPSFVKLVFEHMEKLRYTVSEVNQQRISEFLSDQKNIVQIPTDTPIVTGEVNTQQVLDSIENMEFDEMEDLQINANDVRGAGREEWADVSFEKDPRETASVRMKMFISTIKESVFGEFEKADSAEGAVDISNITDPAKITTAMARNWSRKKLWHSNPTILNSIMARLENDFNILPLRNSYLKHELVNLDSVFEMILNHLAGQSEKTLSNYVKVLRESSNPNLHAVANALMGIGEGGTILPVEAAIQNEFVKVVTKQYNPFLMVLAKVKLDDKNQEYLETRIVEAQRSSQLQTIIKEWQEDNKVSKMMLVKEDGSRVLDSTRARTYHLPLIKMYDILFNKITNTTSAVESTKLLEEAGAILNTVKDELGIDFTIEELSRNGKTWRKNMGTILAKVFKEYGIVLNEDMQRDLTGSSIKSSSETKGKTWWDNVEKFTKGTKKEGNLGAQFSFTQENLPNGIFSTFFSKASGLLSGNDPVSDDEVDVEETLATLNNPLHTEGTTMRVLAKIVAMNTEVKHSSTHNSSENKKIWDFSNNTSLSIGMQQLLGDWDGTMNELLSTDLLANISDGNKDTKIGNFYLKKLNDAKVRKRFNLYYLDGLKFGGRTKGTVRQRMSDREQILTSILLFQNRDLMYGGMLSLTHSDKTMTPIFNGVPKIKANVGNLNLEFNTEFKNIFLSEFRRISNQWNKTYDDAVYDEGKKHFFFLPQFNREVLESRIGQTLFGTNMKIDQALINTLWLPNGTLNSNLESSKVLVDALINEYIQELTRNSMDNWQKNGITTLLIDPKVKSRLWAGQKNLIEPTPEQVKEKEDKILRAAAQEYALNHFLWNVTSSMLFYGDPAQYWKPLGGNATVLDNVASTMDDYAKRLAKDIAPGQDLAFEPGEDYLALTLSDVKILEEYVEREGIKMTSKATDAQEVTTVEEHLLVMFKGGLISNTKYMELKAVIKPGEDYEFSPEQLNIIMNPMKPVYAGARLPDNGARLFDYVKTSSYPLLPQLTKGLEIDKLRKLMETHNPRQISRAHFVSGKKIGSPKAPATLLKPDGSFIHGVNYTPAIQVLTRDNFRIQQDVPYDENKEEIKILSQMNKLIMEGISDIEGFDIAGKSMTGVEVRKEKEILRSKMLSIKVKKFMKNIGAVKTETGWSNPDMKMLSQILKDEAKSRGYSKNEINALEYIMDNGEFEIPLFLHPSVEKIESLVMSMIRDLTSIKMPGKSYVQASSVGYVRSSIRQENEVDKSGIIWTGEYDGTIPLRHQEVITNADGTKTVKPAQVLAPFNFFYEDENGEQIKADIKDFIKEEGGRKVVDTTKIPKELLELIGGRIPNQGHNSMLAIEIVGFVPEAMGDIIIVPSAIVGQMGSDFDVDKLYTYKRPYLYQDGKFSVNKGYRMESRLGADSNEWKELKNATSDKLKREGFKADEDGLYPKEVFNKALGEVVSKKYPDGNVPKHQIRKDDKEGIEAIQNKYFDIHWGVLSHPGVYKKIMSPLDKEDLKEMNAHYKKKQNKLNFFDPVYQLDSFQSGKDAKALVGLTSLTSTFNSVIQDKNLRYGSYAFNRETKEYDEVPFYITVKYGGKTLRLHKLSGNGTSMYYSPSDKNRENGQERTKHDNISIIQSGAVDNAKDKTLNNLNITIATYPALAALHQLETEDGEIVNIDFTTGLSTQEIIWRFSEEMRQGNDSLSETYDADLARAVIAKLKAEYFKRYLELVGPEDANDLWGKASATELSETNFKKQFNKAQDANTAIDPDYIAQQVGFLNLFEESLVLGERIGVLQKTFNQDTKGAGPNLIYASQQNENFINTLSPNSAKVIMNEFEISNGTEQGDFAMSILGIAHSLGNILFPSRAVDSVIQVLSKETKRTINEIPIEQQRTLIRASRSFMLTNTNTFGNNPEVERARLLYGANDQESLAQRVLKAKLANPSNYFLQRLKTDVNVLGYGPDFITYENAKAIRLDDEKNVAAFADMLNSTNTELKLLGEDLIRYAYLINPQNGPTSYIRHIPTSYLVATPVADDMRATAENLESLFKQKNFYSQFIQHHPTQSLQIKSEVFGKYTREGKDYPDFFMFDAGKNEDLVIAQGTEEEKYTTFVHFRSKVDSKVILYKLKSDGEQIVYKRIDTLGKGDKTEYSAKTGADITSLFPDNKADVPYSAKISVENAMTFAADKIQRQLESKDNAYYNWGLGETNTLLETNRALITMSKDRSLPLWYRTAAETLASSSQTGLELEALKSMPYFLNLANITPFSLFQAEDGKGNDGLYNLIDRTLMLKKTPDKINAAETFLHEMGHQRTSAVLLACGYTTKSGMASIEKYKLTERYNEGVEKFKASNPELKKIVERLDELRYKAFAEFRRRYEREVNVDQLLADVEQGILKTDLHRLVYSMSNLPEFLSHVWTYKPLMQFLNTVEAGTNKTVIQQVWEALSELLVQMADFIGMKVKDRSILKEAFLLTYRVNNMSATEYLGITVVEGEAVPTTLVVNKETEADHLASHVESTFNQQVEKTDDGIQFKINITNAKIADTAFETSDSALGAAIDKLVKEKDLIRQSLKGRIKNDADRERHTRIKGYLKSITEDIEELMREQNALAIGEIAKRQLQWANTILTEKDPNVYEAMLATSIIETWVDINKITSIDSVTEVNEQFSDMVAKVQANAQKLDNKLLGYASDAIVILANERGSTLELSDLNINLKDMNRGEKLFITLSRDKNRLIQVLTSIVQEGANNSDEEQTRLIKRLNKINDLAASYSSDLSMVWNKFIQKSEEGKAWGLVQPLNVEWYHLKSKTFNSLRGKAINANKLFAPGTQENIKMRKEGFKTFWNTMLAQADFVHVENLVNPLTGIINEATYNTEKERLMGINGNEEIVTAAMDRAIAQYREYLQKKAEKQEEFDMIELTEEEIEAIQLNTQQLASLTPEEQAETLEDMKTAKLKSKREGHMLGWISHNSPIAFAQTRNESASDNKFKHYMEYTVEFVPKKDSKMFDTTYQEIQSNPTLKTMYDEFVKMSATFRSYFPENIQDSLHDNFLPIVSISEVNSFFTTLKTLSASKIGRMGLEAISISAKERDRQSADKIPIDHLFKGTKNIDDFSRDLPKIFEVFGSMAIHYKNMSAVLPIVETVQMIVKKEAEKRGEKALNKLSNLTEALEDYKDFLIYKKSKAYEGVSDEATYSANPRENNRIIREIKTLNATLEELEYKRDNSGEDLTPEEDEKIMEEIRSIQNKLDGYEDQARYLTKSKMGDVLIGINQLKALSFNPFSALNNITFGVIAAYTHAYGRVDYTPKQLTRGFAKMRSSVGKYLTMGKMNLTEADKIHNIMNRIGVISEIVDTMYGKNSNLSLEQKNALIRSLDPYAWQRSGDYLHKGAMVLAMMENKKVRVMEDGVEKDISLYEALNNEGEWNEEKYGPNPKWSSEIIEDQTDWNKFRDYTRKVSIIVHGNQDKNAPLTFRKNVLLRMIGQFRASWLSEGINTRFGGAYYDEQLGRWVKGRYITMMDIGLNSIPTLMKQALSTFVKMDPFAGVTTTKGEQLTEADKENMRKNLAGISFTMVLGALYFLAKSLAPDDEERKRRRKKGQSSVNVNQLAMNLIFRSYQDLMLYSSPGILDQVTGNLVPSMNVITDAIKATKAIGYYPWNDEKDAGWKTFKRVTRALPFANLINKADYMVNHNLSTAAR